MSKAVMKSVPPALCKLIISGECTMLLSKTKPKIDTPFKCYIYCSQNQFMARKTNGDFWFAKRNSLIQPIDSIQFSGKVIGEFVCDYIDETYPIRINHIKYMYLGDWVKNKANTKNTCLSLKELSDYGKGKPLYGLHISQLKIYDRPKELGEFWAYNEEWHKRFDEEDGYCCYDATNEYGECLTDCGDNASVKNCYHCWEEWSGWCHRLTRPPQSWCYVEEL